MLELRECLFSCCCLKSKWLVSPFLWGYIGSWFCGCYPGLPYIECRASCLVFVSGMLGGSISPFLLVHWLWAQHSECLNLTLTQRVAQSKPSILQTWVFYPVGYLCLGHLHKNFHLPGTIFKGLKFKGKKCQNGQFLIILASNFRPLKMIPGR